MSGHQLLELTYHFCASLAAVADNTPFFHQLLHPTRRNARFDEWRIAQDRHKPGSALLSLYHVRYKMSKSISRERNHATIIMTVMTAAARDGHLGSMMRFLAVAKRSYTT
jgi:hypothetical protein